MSVKNTISDKQQQLVGKLKELFQMDQADLDFGIYRIMNAKHGEIEKFLNDDLLPSVRKALESFTVILYLPLNQWLKFRE